MNAQEPTQAASRAARTVTVNNAQPRGGDVVLTTVADRAFELLERRGAPSPSTDLVQLLELDAVLTAAIFRLARSPLYGPSAHERGLDRAVAVIGTTGVTTVIRGVTRRGDVFRMDDDGEVEGACRRWTCALSIGAAVRWLGNQGDYDNPAEAYLAGLLAIECVDPADMSETRALRAWEVAEYGRFGVRVEAALFDLLASGAIVPDLSAAATPFRDDESVHQLRELLRLARGIVAALQLSRPVAQAPDAPGSAEYAKILEHGAAAAVAEAVTLELAHAASLLHLPAGTPADFAARLATEERRRRVAHSKLTTADLSLSLRADLVSRIVRVHQSLQSLSPETAIHDILNAGLAAVHEHMGYDRLVLLERDAVRPHVARVRQVLCRTQDPPDASTTTIEVPLETLSALVRAEATGGGNAVRIERRMDRALLAVLGAPDAAVAPVRAGRGAVGLVVADCALSARSLTDVEVEAFGAATGILGLILENAALISEGRTLRGLAEKDELTGVNNRRRILDLVHHEVDRARRYGKPLSIALVDVDHFKAWNDLHGHPVGDMVLQSVAQLISSVGREIDHFGRYGGEEFLVVLPETAADHGMIYAERLRMIIEAHGEELAKTYPQSSLTVSLGLTQLYSRGDDVYQMIARADAALYAAKKHGRNRVCVDMAPPPQAPPPTPARGVLGEL